jgi:two-component system sensor histidine kinase RegB
MNDRTLSLFNRSARSEWIRLRTLIILRWLAILGQIIALVICANFLDIDLDIFWCLLVVGISIIVNLVAGFMLPFNKRLSERQTLVSQTFDLLQLGALLYLTGGLNNPFAVLILAPVTVAATALTLNATIFLSSVAFFIITTLAFFFFPLTLNDGTVLAMPKLFITGTWTALGIGIIFLGAYARRITIETFSMSQALTATQMALEREHRLTALGGVVAAAAHEMGTPLATIKLVSSELQEELSENSELLEDATLIHEQATRLGAILKDMGRMGKDDKLMHSAPLTTILQEAAEPHEARGKEIIFTANGKSPDNLGADVPIILRHPEIVHSLRNLIQNAVDFADSKVLVHTMWNEDVIRVMIRDDGVGFPPDLMGRLGDPFLARRAIKKARQSDRPEYEGMGLGLFIAKTLLERTGAELLFANTNDDFSSITPNPTSTFRGGALVNVSWPRHLIETKLEDARAPLGDNALNQS